MAITEDDLIRSTPRASKDPKSYEYARQMVYVLRTTWERAKFDLLDWEKELEQARRNEIWKRHKPPYGSLEELLAKEVGFDEVEFEVKKRDLIKQLRETNPDWTQQRIADEVGVSQPYVNQVISETSQSDKILIPDHINNRNDEAAYRKLPEDVRAKVDAKEISLNAAAIKAGVRKKPSPEELAVKHFRKAENKLQVLRLIVESLDDHERSKVRVLLKELTQ